MRAAAFIDRDGVLNHRIPGDTYVTRPEELRVLPHAAEAVESLRENGYLIVVITNQRGVARGFMSQADVEAIHPGADQHVPRSRRHQPAKVGITAKTAAPGISP